MYADQPDDPAFIPKLYVKSGWNPPREDYDLEENLYKSVKSYWKTLITIHLGGKAI